MTVDHLFTQLVEDIGDIVSSFLLGNLGIEDHVEEYVTKLLFQRFLILLQDRIAEFVDLLDRHGSQSVDGLGMVPRTLCPQAVHNIQSSLEGFQFVILILHRLQK